MIPSHIFRAYDVRGVYGVDLTEAMAERMGLAFGHYLGGLGRKVAIGMDVRLSSLSLKEAFIRGMVGAGCHVVDMGLVPTPTLYYAVVARGLDGGVMVTASHNPPEWNGFKLCIRGARIVAEGMGMEDFEALANHPELAEVELKGSVEHNEALLEDYTNFLISKVKLNRSLKVALDLSNGPTSLTAPELFKKLGCSVIALNAELDGRFPKHPPEPTEETLAELREVVVKEGADLGVGYDGDGDRSVFIDDKGRVLTGDLVTALLAREYLKDEVGSFVVIDVSSSSIVEEEVRKLGGRVFVSRVGHAYIMEAMMETKAVLGGERSSHLYFRELWGIDDGVYASLKLAELLSRVGEPLSSLVDSLSRYFSKSKNYDFPDELKFKAVAEVAKELKEEGVRILEVDGVKTFFNKGWFLIRPSNTQPLIKLIVEARNKEDLEHLFKKAEGYIKHRMKPYYFIK